MQFKPVKYCVDIMFPFMFQSSMYVEKYKITLFSLAKERFTIHA